MRVSRREFVIGTTAMGAAALIVNSSSNAAPEDGNLIVDTHQHLWDLSKFNLPWLAGAPEVYRHSYRPQEYAEATKGLNVRAVYMEVDVAPEQRPAEAQYVIDLCRTQTGATRAAVIGGRPGAPGFIDYVKNAAKSGYVRGVRQVLHADSTPAKTCLSDAFQADVRALGELGLTFDLCMRPKELADGVELVKRSPGTRFIVDHLGNGDPKAFTKRQFDKPPAHEPDQWKRDMDSLAKLPNTICKVSGVIAAAWPGVKADDLAPVINHCLDTFGPSRVVFGGDWPVCLKQARLAEWIAILTQIISNRPAADQRKLWAENAVAFYQLKL